MVLASVLDTLNKWDTWLFLKINTQWTSPFWDSAFPFLRDKMVSTPLYIFLLLFVFINFGWKSWKWLLLVIVTVILSDQFSSTFVKYFFDRVRPCNEPTLRDQIRILVNYVPQSPSFTSSHAVNHFALATYFYRTLKPYFDKWAYLLFLWAGMVAYGQVYVGVHYPGDILGGAVVGALIGWFTSMVFLKKIKMPELIDYGRLTIDN
ncbi:MULTISPECIES: phosphatase PAP2 family protein [Chitinophagaceae]